MNAWYWLLLVAGTALLAILAVYHQRILPLERELVRPAWQPVEAARPSPGVRLERADDRLIVHYPGGAPLAFHAADTRVPDHGYAVLELGSRRLLALLDQGKRRRLYLIDAERAAQGGTLDAGMVGWWRHGNGYLLAAAGDRLVEVHRCLGRDLIYLVDPYRAMTGHAYGMGIERTLISPKPSLSWLAVEGQRLVVGEGQRAWQTEIA